MVHAVQNHKSFARLGIIVGKRTVQHAVARNFLKRLIRETFRAQQHRLVGYDVLVRVRRPVARGDARIAQDELTDLLDAAVA
jgi:ribonuclease P protein component